MTASDGLGLIITLMLGLGCLAFVSGTWVIFLLKSGNVLLGASMAIVALGLAAAALVRIPVALLIVFGGAAIAGTAFMFGAVNVWLP